MKTIPLAEAERFHVAGIQQTPAVTLIPGASVTPESVQWLWNGFLAKGKLHIVAGKPSAGKTTVVTDLCGTISRGGTFPDGARAAAGNVLFWSGEDGISDTIAPRLIAAGADMARIYFVGERHEGAERQAFDPSADMPLLTEAAKRAGGISLLVLDPIVSAVAGDSHKNAEVRRGLQPVVEFAAETEAAVIGITHLSKGTSGQDPLDRITGSLAFGAVTRIAFLVARENCGADGPGRRVITRAKSNLGPDGAGFYYDIRPAVLAANPNIATSRVEWLGKAEGSARDIMGVAETVHDDDAKSALDEACEFLLTELHDGPVSAKTVKRNAELAGITAKTLRRAADRVAVRKEKAGFESGWTWRLPGDAMVPTAEDAHEESQDAHSPSVGTLVPFAPPNDGGDAEEVDL